LDYRWLAGLPGLNREFLPEDYSNATKNSEVAKIVFVEAGCAASQNVGEVDWICELASREPRLKGIVAHARLEFGARVNPELTALAKKSLVKGVRRNLQGEGDPNFCLQPDFIRGVHLLPQFGFTFDLCLGHQQLSAVTELVRRCPEVDFVLDHCAKPAIRDRQLDPWRQQLRELSESPNVLCKLSGLVTEANPMRCRAEELQPYVRHALDCFGFDRVLFGSDWPVCQLATSFASWLAALKTILANETEANLTRLFRTNAEKIYRV